MFVVNKSPAVFNYGNKSYGPGRTFEMSDKHAGGRAEKAMLKSGALGVAMSMPTAKPSEGLKVEELKAALTERNIAFDASAKKDELAALLDAAPQ